MTAAAAESIVMATPLFLAFLALPGVLGTTESSDLDEFSPFGELETWNMSQTESRLWYHDYVCDYSEPCEEFPHHFPRCPVCYQDHRCAEFKDCCPHLLLEDSSLPRDGEPSTSLSCHTTLGDSSFFMVTSCPDKYVTSSIARKCVNPNTTDWRQVLPVSSLQTGETYLNKYCALCNDVGNYTMWKLLIDCSNSGHDPDVMYSASSVDDMFSTVVQTGACAVKALAPMPFRPRKCFHRPREVITECNVTGSWRAYDERVERACLEFPQTFYGNYGNVFCFLCNHHMEWRQMGCVQDITLPDVSLTSILDLHDEEPEVKSTLGTGQGEEGTSACHDNHFRNPATQQCRPLVCDEGKYIRNGACTNLFDMTSGQSYVIQLDVTLQTDNARLGVIIVDDLMANVTQEVRQPALESGMFSSTTFRVVFRKLSCEGRAVLEMWVTLTVSPTQDMKTDDAEALLLTLYSDLEVNRGDNSFSLRGRLVDVPLATDEAPTEFIICKTGGAFVSVPPWWEPVDSFLFRNQPGVRPREIPLTRFLTCRQVELIDGEYNFTNDTGELEVATPLGGVKTEKFKVTDNAPRMCVEDFLALFSDSDCQNVTACPGNRSAGNHSDPGDVRATPLSPSGLLSLVCSIVSLLFLAASFATYAVFKKLRTPTGVCTMCMIAALFLAQGVFQFGANQTEIAGLCVALGVLAHYLWLSATFWMNACTSLMFYRLMFPLTARVRLASGSRVLLVTSLYALLSPALVVASSMAANVGLHGDLGYGGALCYIKRVTTRRLGLALPIGVLVLVNLVLFLVTVVTLRRGPGVSSSKESKVGLYACAKLSAVTGLSWGFLFLYEAVRVEGVQYAAVVLFGLYGVVVFWALVLNRHVVALCRAWVCGGRQQASATSSSIRHDPHTSFTSTG